MKIRKIARLSQKISKKSTFKNKFQVQKIIDVRIFRKENKIMKFWVREEVPRGKGYKLMIKTIIWLPAACFHRLLIEDLQLLLLINLLNFLSLILFPEIEPIINNFGQLISNILKIKIYTKIIIVLSMVP